MTKLQQLEIELAKAKSEAQTWEKVFKLMTHHGVPVNDEVLKKIRSKKTTAEEFEEGQKQAKLFLASHNIQELEAQAKGEGMGIQNAWLAKVGQWLLEQAIETIVGFIIQLIKENAVAAADKLLDYTDDKIVDGYMKLSEEDKTLFKNQLKEHPRFAELLKKIEEREKQ